MQDDEMDNSSLKELGVALLDVNKELKNIPVFRVLTQNALAEELSKISSGHLVSRVSINVLAGRKPISKEPVGRLLDVLIECLRQGRAPQYDPEVYGVFEHPNLTSREDAITQISVADIEMVLRRVQGSFPARYVAALQRYWENADALDNTATYPHLSRKAALALLQNIVFMRELVVLVDQQGLSLKEGTAISRLIQPGLTSTCYGVSIETNEGEYVNQSSMFVLPADGVVHEQLVAESEGALVFYSSDRGIERFASAAELRQVISSRLSSADSQVAFLQALPGDERKVLTDGAGIRFTKIRANLFERYTDALLRNLYDTVGQHLALLNKFDADFEEIVALVEFAQSLGHIPGQAKLRQAGLLRRVQSNARPLWLKEADQATQEIYDALEQRLLESQVQYHEATKGFASFKDYVKDKVEDFISPGTDERIDPDTVLVNVTYVLPLDDGKKIEHRERKTLTQLFMYGVHEDSRQIQVSVEGQYYNSKFTHANLIYAIRSMNLRAAYNPVRQAFFSQNHVIESLRELLGRKAALSLFRAQLRKQFSMEGYNALTRYHTGDSASLISARVALAKGFELFKDLMVYSPVDIHNQTNTVYLYAPGFPTGQEWYEFSDASLLRKHIAAWVTDDQAWEYLQSQAIVSDISRMTAHVTGDARGARRITPWDFVLQYRVDDFPQEYAIKSTLDWEIKQIEAVTPVWYRNARVEDQQLFTRLNTDLKLLTQASKEALAVTPFHEFARELIMKSLQQYLSRDGGSAPVIDPDKVRVKFHAGPEMTLTNLFVQWQLWGSDVSVFEKVFQFTPLGSLLVELKEKLRTATFKTLEGYTVTVLNAKVINDLIDLKPGEVYDQYLRDKFLLATDRPLKEDLFRKIKQNEMLRTALLQKINGTLSQDQFNWLQTLINGFDHDLPRGNIIEVGVRPGAGVYGFTLEGKTITGAYVFGRIFSGRLEQIVYVPGSHDGRDFFALETLADRLKLRAFTADVLNLVRLEDKAVIENLMRKYWSWPIQATATPELVNSYQIKSFKKGEYSALIGKFIADVDFQTTSSAEAFWKDARILIEFALDVASLFVPPLGLGLSVLRITQSVVKGIVASSHGSESEANAHFAAAWRGAIMLYIGKVSAIGAPVNPIGLLSQIRDFADLVSTVTGVPVTESYLTAVAVAPHEIESTTRLIN